MSSIVDYIIKLVDEQNVPQLRATLTLLNSRIKMRDKLSNSNYKILIHKLLKLSFIFPVVGVHCFRCIETILKGNKEIRNVGSRIIEESLDFVELEYAETDIEIWIYYLLGKYSESKNRNKLVTKVIQRCNKDPHSTDSLILMCLIKSNFNDNKRIWDYVINTYKSDNNSNNNSNGLEGISKSRWWPVIVKLYIYVNSVKKGNDKLNEFKSELQNLFITKNNKIKYEELGIFELII